MLSTSSKDLEIRTDFRHLIKNSNSRQMQASNNGYMNPVITNLTTQLMSSNEINIFYSRLIAIKHSSQTLNEGKISCYRSFPVLYFVFFLSYWQTKQILWKISRCRGSNYGSPVSEVNALPSAPQLLPSLIWS